MASAETATGVAQPTGTVRLGCAVWVCRDWLGTVYPQGTPEGDFLRWYSRSFPAVESNATFYGLPTVATLTKWRESTPSGFRFWLKVPQTISHRGSLLAQGAAIQLFRERLAALGDRLGGVFLQLPPDYGPEHWVDLQSFGAAHTWPCPLAIEVRHRQWFETTVSDRLDAWLQRQGMVRVILDSRPIYASGATVPQTRPKPRLPLHAVATADTVMVRYISHPEGDRNQPYLAEWGKRLQEWYAQGKTVYFFVHCPREGRSPTNAQRFQSHLQTLGMDGGLSLPQAKPAHQLSLFTSGL